MEQLFVVIISNVLQRSFKIYLGILLGYIFIRSPLQKYRAPFVKLTINIFTPILIISSLINLNTDEYVLVPIFAAISVSLIGYLIPLGMGKLQNEQPSGAELCTASFPNALNFPFPIIYAFAPDMLGIAGIYLAVQIILRNTFGFYISGVKMSKQQVIDILKFPPVLGIFLGFALQAVPSAQITTQHPIIKVLFEVGIYMTLMTVGFSIKKPSIEFKNPLLRVGISRFVIAPLIFISTYFILKFPLMVFIPLIIQSAAPPAVYNSLYAERFGLDTKLTSQVILVLTFVALIILPFEIVTIDLLLGNI